MTKHELLDELNRCKNNDGDPEVAHCEADEALLKFIGDAEVTALFESIEKWYA